MILAAAMLLFPAAGLRPTQEPPKPEAVQEPPAPQEKPDATPVPAVEGELPASAFVLSLRGGAWFHSAFEAITAQGFRRIKAEAMGDFGIDVGYRFGSWTLGVSFDHAFASDVGAWIAGAHVTLSEPFLPESVLGTPVTAGLSLGVIGGRFEVDLAGFGDFQAALGFQARAELSTPLSADVGILLWVDYRHIAFDYDEPVLSGDQEAVGSSFALGAGLTLRF